MKQQEFVFSMRDAQTAMVGGAFRDDCRDAVVTVDAAHSPNSAIPRRIHGRAAALAGCRELRLAVSLAPGFYELIVVFKEPSRRIDFGVYFDHRLIGRNAVYFDQRHSQPAVEHIYPLVSATTGDHMVALRLPDPLEKESLELVELRLRPTRPGAWGYPQSADGEDLLHLDLWGWQAAIHEQRTRAADNKHFMERVVNESYKWGANFWRFWNWTGQPMAEVVRHAHSRGLIVIEHMFPPRDPERGGYDLEGTMQFVEVWAIACADALNSDWQEIVDAWQPEELAAGADGAVSNSENIIRVNHAIWRHNPGAFTGVTGFRPNEHPNLGYSNTVDVYKGPSFINSSMTGGVGNDDKYPLRLFFGDAGVRNPFNDVFLFNQNDARPMPLQGFFGGRSWPDWMIKQCHDFLRPRAYGHVHETGVHWHNEGDRVIPAELRDYTYAISINGVKGALASRLGSTGRDGTLWNVVHVARNSTARAIEHTGDDPRDEHPATTGFVGNNYLRLYRYAFGEKGVLRYDFENLAHFDSNSLSVALSEDFLRTRIVGGGDEDVLFRVDCDEKHNSSGAAEAAVDVASAGGNKALCRLRSDGSAPAALRLRFNAKRGTYLCKVEQLEARASSIVDVFVDDVFATRYEAAGDRRDHTIPFYLHAEGPHEMRIALVRGEEHGLHSITVEATHLEAEIARTLGTWNDSSAEFRGNPEAYVPGRRDTEYSFDWDKDPVERFSPGVGYGDPNPVNLSFSERDGSYLLAIRAKAQLATGSHIRINLNRNGVPPSSQRPCRCSRNGWRGSRSTASPATAAGTPKACQSCCTNPESNTLQLEMDGRNGHLFDVVELVRAPMKDKLVEHGGHLAVLEETVTAKDCSPALTEKRRTASRATPPPSPWRSSVRSRGSRRIWSCSLPAMSTRSCP